MDKHDQIEGMEKNQQHNSSSGSKSSLSVLPVLVRPAQVRNIGAAVRACANFSVHTLAIIRVNPFTAEELREIRVASAGAFDLVTLQVYNNIPAAVEQCRLVAAIHGKHRSGNLAPLSPEEFFSLYSGNQVKEADESVIENTSPPPTPYSPQHPAALLFGTESTGLTLDDLQYAHCTVTIPTAPNFTSMNLSHALAIILYEYRRHHPANHAEKSPTAETPTPQKAPPPSTIGLQEQFLKKLNDLTSAPESPRVSIEQWRGLLHRAGITEDEISLLFNTVKKLTRK